MNEGYMCSTVLYNKMDPEVNLCDHCEAKEATIVCKECFQGMWCSEQCRLADAIDHEEYDCYHPDDLENDTVLEEVEYQTNDPTEARQMLKEMIGAQFLIGRESRARTRRLRRQRRDARKRRRRLRKKRKRVEKERRERRRLRRERRRETKEEDRLRRAKERRDEEIIRDGEAPIRDYSVEEDDVPILEEAHIASFFV